MRATRVVPNRKSRGGAQCLVAAVVMLIRVEALLAQQPTDGGSGPQSATIEEIIVTAQRREEPLQDVPISIVAIGADSLSFRGIREVGDLQLEVPGLAYGKDGSGGQQISIRGIGLEVTNSSVEVPIATYIDGVYQTRSFRRPNLGLDLQRIEVLRGPQGTLFGRNATIDSIADRAAPCTFDAKEVALTDRHVHVAVRVIRRTA